VGSAASRRTNAHPLRPVTATRQRTRRIALRVTVVPEDR